MTNTLSVYDKQHSLICSTQFLNNLFGKHWEMKHFDSPVQLKTPNFLYYLGNTGQNRGSWNMRILGNSWFKINECFNYILLSSSSAQVCGTGVLLGLDFCFVATSRNAFSTGANCLQPVDTISSDLVISAEKCSTKLHPNKSAPPAGGLWLAEKEATAASTKM